MKKNWGRGATKQDQPIHARENSKSHRQQQHKRRKQAESCVCVGGGEGGYERVCFNGAGRPLNSGSSTVFGRDVRLRTVIVHVVFCDLGLDVAEQIDQLSDGPTQLVLSIFLLGRRLRAAAFLTALPRLLLGASLLLLLLCAGTSPDLKVQYKPFMRPEARAEDKPDGCAGWHTNLFSASVDLEAKVRMEGDRATTPSGTEVTWCCDTDAATRSCRNDSRDSILVAGLMFLLRVNATCLLGKVQAEEMDQRACFLAIVCDVMVKRRFYALDGWKCTKKDYVGVCALVCACVCACDCAVVVFVSVRFQMQEEEKETTESMGVCLPKGSEVCCCCGCSNPGVKELSGWLTHAHTHK